MHIYKLFATKMTFCRYFADILQIFKGYSVQRIRKRKYSLFNSVIFVEK